MSKLSVHSTFLSDDDGSGTAWWVLWMLMFMVFGGVAAHSANAWRMRAELQATADAAAHAGVIDLPDIDAARARADAIAAVNMDPTEHGDVLTSAEIEIGVWNSAAGKFQALPDVAHPEKDAIRVTTRRDATNSNRLKTYFLRLVGMDSWNVDAQAVAQRYWPICLNQDALIARHVVDLQSNNDFESGLCIHGNDHVEVNNQNTWATNVHVTMPSLADFVVPSSDIDVHNPGLANALGEEWFDPKIVDYTHDIINSLLDPASANLPSYIGIDEYGDTIDPNDIVIEINSQQFDVASAEQGYVYHVNCPGNSLLNLGNNVVLEKVVVVADCRIATGNNSLYEDVILASFAGDKPNESQYAKSINIGQSNQMGADDGCATTGNVKLFAGGSIHSAAGVEFYGVQAVAIWDVHLAAQAEGLEGILILAGNDIDISSNNAFGGACSGGVQAIAVPYFRLVL